LSKKYKLVLATKNPHKIEEIKSILGDGIIYLNLGGFPGLEIKETGRALLQNSVLKAEFAYKLCSIPSLADDSGLFIDALNGEPGVFSSRYARNDNDRIIRVLKNLRNKKVRTATFKAVFVFYYQLNKYEVFEGICPGRIALEPKGKNGFGYDPIFVPKGYNKSFAELGPKVKNRISHRALALKKFKVYLRMKSKQLPDIC